MTFDDKEFLDCLEALRDSCCESPEEAQEISDEISLDLLPVYTGKLLSWFSELPSRLGDCKEFMRGVSITIGLVGIFVLFIAFIGTPDSPQKVGKPYFKVVDQYKNCDVVRYVDPSNRYHYFLHCPKAP